MTPAYFHKISVVISERKKFFFYAFFFSVCILFGSSLLRSFISADNTFLRLVNAVSGLALFWCVALGGLWLSYKNGPLKVNASTSVIKTFQFIGHKFQWLYSIIFGIWFIGLIIMTLFIPFSVLFS